MLTVLDLETTGLPLWKESMTDPAQPRIVQIAALHFNAGRKIRNRFACTTARDGSVSASAAAAKHGISDARRSREGLKLRPAIAMLCDMLKLSTAVASFSWNFDRFILESEMLRSFGQVGEGWPGPTRPSFRMICVKTHAEQYANGGKNMTLIEAHEAILGQPYPGDDDADAGVMASANILFRLVDLGEVKL